MLKDMSDGIFMSISMGYRYDQCAMVDAEGIDGFPAYKVVRWTPHEISLSSSPLDHTVGVGRVREEAHRPRRRLRGEIMTQRKFLVRPASDFELTEKREKCLKLSQGEFDRSIS
jgi:hypothetical protein